MTGAAVQPWVPRWVAIPLFVLWLIALTLWAVDRWQIRHPRRSRPVAPPARPYDWKVDGDCTYRQPTHVHRRVS